MGSGCARKHECSIEIARDTAEEADIADRWVRYRNLEEVYVPAISNLTECLEKEAERECRNRSSYIASHSSPSARDIKTEPCSVPGEHLVRRAPKLEFIRGGALDDEMERDPPDNKDGEEQYGELSRRIPECGPKEILHVLEV